ncbi:acetoin dehydrogenase dihydrolipoyllysine-residue acetyltransferase subunit [Taklimakanibacter lacteus]|uniref:acetoin dehydrogenase dihydrolipoyllysine-residue acetyltransferase subunit n=1 Tax=Taklimakanibacter lacteus TaxID=2268456 RepID=UPI000E66417D
MAEPVLVPQVGQDLTEAKIVALHVKLGDKVKKGDLVAEVESEKASFEVEAFAAGTVIHMPYRLGDVATVLTPLLLLGEPGEAVDAADNTMPAAAAPAISAPAAMPAASTDGILRSSPLARRLARSNGLELRRIMGSGPKGAVIRRDIEAALAGRRGVVDATPTAAAAIAFRDLKAGTGDPIVFIHGFGSDLSSWRSFLGNLTLANPMRGLDLPAHGASPPLEDADFATIVAQVGQALAAQGEAGIHLVGHSLGAAVAAAIARRGKPKVRSLTLLAPAGLGPRIDGEFIAGFLAAQTEAALASWLGSLFHDRAGMPQAMVRATLAARAGSGLAAGQRRAAAKLFEGSTQLFSIREALDHFDGPCRVIVGVEDAIIPAAQATNLPGHVALHRLAGVGHLPQIEAAALVGRLVAETVRAAG